MSGTSSSEPKGNAPGGSRPIRVCVFCGSRPGASASYAAAAAAFAHALVRRGGGLVYGGASVGLMGMLADTVLAAGGECIGVIPEGLASREIAHAGLAELIVTATLAERKERMIELADAFVALPGGAGTLDELSEVWTGAQLGLHAKPIGILNTGGFYDHLLRFVDHAVDGGFIKDADRAMLLVDPEPAPLLETLFRAIARGAASPPR